MTCERGRRVGPVERNALAASAASVLLAVLIVLLAGCGASSTSPPASASSTASAQAAQATSTAETRAARATATALSSGPVHAQVVAKVQGTITQGNVVLEVTTTVINQSDGTIHLTGECPDRPIELEVRNTSTGFDYRVNQGVTCPGSSPFDDTTGVAAGGTHSWTERLEVSALLDHGRATKELFQPGVYTVVATISTWHQGTLDQFLHATPTPLYGSASAQTTVTIT